IPLENPVNKSTEFDTKRRVVMSKHYYPPFCVPANNYPLVSARLFTQIICKVLDNPLRVIAGDCPKYLLNSIGQTDGRY
ncbi:MAG: hypothetical protein AAFS06_22010, partial [Cyanobacteria bacterium J06631_12]